MLELLCPLSPPLINTSQMVTPLLELLCALPGFSPTRYDLNRHDSWRAFDLEKTHVDALSQRVQLVRVQGLAPEHLAMLSLGKLGEPPTLMARLPDAPPDAFTSALLPLLDALPMRQLTITSQAWKTHTPDKLSPIMACPTAHEPAHWQTLSPPAPITRHTTTHTTLWQLTDSFDAPSPTLLRSLETLT